MSPAVAGSRVEILADTATVAAAAAAELAALVARSPGPFSMALAGGSTPRVLYERLAESPLREQIPWDRVRLFFGDERAVGPGHPDSNWGMASRALVSKVDVTAFRMEAELNRADAYDALLRTHVPTRGGQGGAMPVLDLVLLGIGEDGHTASLFPGTAALEERTRAVVMNHVPQLDTRRMTLTYPAINAARRVWLLVTGERKQEIVQGLLGGEPTAVAWPVRDVHPATGELVWWLDEAAAARLPAG